MAELEASLVSHRQQSHRTSPQGQDLLPNSQSQLLAGCGSSLRASAPCSILARRSPWLLAREDSPQYSLQDGS